MTVRERKDHRNWRSAATAGRLLGSAVAHHDFVDKVRGTLSYADDWQMPGMLYGKIVRAQRPSAGIRAVSSEEASRLPGVAAVLAAEDVPSNSVREEPIGLGFTLIETPVLAATEVRYEGEPLALVAAEHPDIAEHAAELITVEYEDRPAVFDVAAALAPEAPPVHRAADSSSNVLVEWVVGHGDVESALDEADVVVEGTYRTHRVDHAYLEPEAGVGWVDTDGLIVLRVSTQVIEHARQIAKILGLPHNKVRVIGSYMGGGFGGKEAMTVEPYLALLVHATRRPVKMVWSRQESLLARPKSHPITMRYRTGATRDGHIVAQEVDLIGDAGAYPQLSSRVMFAAAVLAAGPYRTPSARIRSRAVLTNNVPTTAFRGFGAMQVTLGYEGQMDRLANAVGLTGTEVRRRNFLRKGDTLPSGEELETAVDLPEAMKYALNTLGERPQPSRPDQLVGRGFACNMQPYGRALIPDRASCWMSLEPDGTLIIRAGVTDLGGGQAASLCQIAGEVLGLALKDISVHIADSALTPLAGGTYATRQLYMSGNAALKTAVELRTKVAHVAGELLKVSADEVIFAGGKASATARSELSLAELVAACRERGVPAEHLGTFDAEGGEFDPQRGQGRTFPDYTYGAHACDVEVDPGTGQVRVLAYVACHDVGKALNPLRVCGQIEGGVVQGIGYALTEEIVTVDGSTQSTLFGDYLIPSAPDLPDIHSHYLESSEGKGPFGARGIGEPPIGPPAPALASAIEDATGVRLTELPFKPERILEALAQAKVTGRNDSETTPAVPSGPLPCERIG